MKIRGVLILAGLPLACLICGLVACSDSGDGGSTGPPDDEPLSNLMAAGYDVVADAVAATAGAGTPAFESLAYLASQIRPALGTSPATGRASGAVTCLPTSVQGHVFSWNEQLQRYTATPDPSLGEKARFLLYPVAAGGGSVTSSLPIGHFDIECAGALPSAILNGVVSVDGVDLAEARLVTLSAALPTFVFGPSKLTLRNPSGVDEITFDTLAEGKYEGTASDYLDHSIEVSDALAAFDARLSNLHITMGMEDKALGANGLPEAPIYLMGSGASQYDAEGTLLWNASVLLSVPDESGVIANIFGGSRAPLEYEYRGTPASNGILACFSGPYDAPEVTGSAADGGCAGGVITNPIPLGAAELTALGDGYSAMLQVLDVAAPLWIISMALLTP